MDYSALSSDEEYSIPIVNKPPLENFNSFFCGYFFCSPVFGIFPPGFGNFNFQWDFSCGKYNWHISRNLISLIINVLSTNCVLCTQSREKLARQGPPLKRSSSILIWRGRRRQRGLFTPAPGRGRTSSTISIANLLCWFLIIFMC